MTETLAEKPATEESMFVKTAHGIDSDGQWATGDNSFETDPPNAVLAFLEPDPDVGTPSEGANCGGHI